VLAFGHRRRREPDRFLLNVLRGTMPERIEALSTSLLTANSGHIM